MSNFVIGIDYGTDSVRSLIVNADTGEEVATDVHYYSRWKQGKYCNPHKNQFRHHPLDYIEGLEITLKNCINSLPQETKDNIKGISVDTTGSTPAPCDKNGNILALLPDFQENPNAMFVLWKDHTGVKEADEINTIAKTWGGEDYTKFEGGVYSSEWFWSKILHVLREDEQIRKEAFSWIELCDWIPAILTNHTDPLTLKRSRCAAGHKAMWHESWDGLPNEEFLQKVDPLLKGLRNRLYSKTYEANQPMGELSKEWLDKLGLKGTIIVGVGAFDAHMGAVGANIKPYSLVKIMGTSTCDVLIAPKSDVEGKLIKGICGQVDGSVIPNLIGMEAGQSGFGDLYAWFKQVLSWPLRNILSDNDLADKIEAEIIPKLSDAASSVPISESNLISLDWMNGRRTPNANQLLTGAITGINLGTDAPRIFRSIVEATAFGARAINECFESQGISIKEIIGIGGVSKKSSFLMQILADVLNRPIRISGSDQTCALGAAMCAAAAAGVYNTVEGAQLKMNSGFSKEYLPIPENVEQYNIIYNKYLELGEYVESHIQKMV